MINTEPYGTVTHSVLFGMVDKNKNLAQIVLSFALFRFEVVESPTWSPHRYLCLSTLSVCVCPRDLIFQMCVALSFSYWVEIRLLANMHAPRSNSKHHLNVVVLVLPYAWIMESHLVCWVHFPHLIFGSLDSNSLFFQFDWDPIQIWWWQRILWSWVCFCFFPFGNISPFIDR